VASAHICQIIDLFSRLHFTKEIFFKYFKRFFILLHKNLFFKKKIWENFSISKKNRIPDQIHSLFAKASLILYYYYYYKKIPEQANFHIHANPELENVKLW